jgi:peroxiredoxin
MIFLLLAFTISIISSASAEVTGPAGSTQKLVQRIRDSAHREPPGLEIQSLLTAAELLRPTEPSAADTFIRDCLTILESGKHIDAQITANVLEIGMRIDPADVLQSVPLVADQRAVDNALISYYLGQGRPEMAVALVDQSRLQGLTDLSGAILILRQLIRQQPGEGATFFNKMLSSVPRILNPEEALFLLRAVREIVLLDPPLTLKAIRRIAVSAQSTEFPSGFPGTLTAKYRIAGRDLWTSDIRESVLLPVSAYLHVLAPDEYPDFPIRSEWRELLSAVNWKTILKSTQPLQIVWLKPDSRPARETEAVARAGREISSPGLASLLPVQAEESVSERSLDGLFGRLRRGVTSNRARSAIERQALEEVRRMPPDRQQAGAAAELLSLAAGQESTAKLEPITGFLLRSLLPLARGDLRSEVGEPEDAWCASMYSFVALEIHQHHLTTSEDDPSLTTRLALLDLRDRIQDAYDFTLKDANGRRYTLRQLRGHVVVLQFWSAWCGTCARSLPRLEKLYRDNAKNDVVVLGISDEPEAVTRSFINEHGYTFPFLFDEDSRVSGHFGIFVLPTAIVIDQTGRIVSSIVNDAPSGQLQRVVSELKFK